MVCEHLRPLEEAIQSRNIRETFRSQAWSSNCREWVYFDCFIDAAAVRGFLHLADCVLEHAHRGTNDGQERGFVCSICHDGVMGTYEAQSGSIIFRG